jgi:hypothetical protein
MTYSPAADPRPEPGFAADVVWFDSLVTNADRSPRNPNILAWHRRLYLIDHGAALYVHHSWQDPDAHARRPLATLADHVLRPRAGPIDSAHARLASLVTTDLVRASGRDPRRRLAADGPAGGPDGQRGATCATCGAPGCRPRSRSGSTGRPWPVRPSSTVCGSSHRVERGELVNVGVVLHADPHFDCRSAHDGRRRAIEALAPDVDLDSIADHLEVIERIVRGDLAGGPIAALPAPERFRWIVSPSSTIIQPSEVHSGLTEDPEATLEHLFATQVG